MTHYDHRITNATHSWFRIERANTAKQSLPVAQVLFLRFRADDAGYSSVSPCSNWPGHATGKKHRQLATILKWSSVATTIKAMIGWCELEREGDHDIFHFSSSIVFCFIILVAFDNVVH